MGQFLQHEQRALESKMADSFGDGWREINLFIWGFFRDNPNGELKITHLSDAAEKLGVSVLDITTVLNLLIFNEKLVTIHYVIEEESGTFFSDVNGMQEAFEYLRDKGLSHEERLSRIIPVWTAAPTIER